MTHQGSPRVAVREPTRSPRRRPAGERYPHGGPILLSYLGEQVQSAVTFDCVIRQTENARAALYVLESTATPCRTPRLLALRVREDTRASAMARFA